MYGHLSNKVNNFPLIVNGLGYRLSLYGSQLS
jgi:hypothetical protein